MVLFQIEFVFETSIRSFLSDIGTLDEILERYFKYMFISVIIFNYCINSMAFDDRAQTNIS